MAGQSYWTQGNTPAPWDNLFSGLGDALTGAKNTLLGQPAHASDVMNYAFTGSTTPDLRQAGVVPPVQPANVASLPDTGTNYQALGAITPQPQPQPQPSSGGNSGGGGSTTPTFTTNTGQQLNEQDWLNSSQYRWEQAQREQSAAENQRLNTQFDYTKAQLEGQLGGLGRQRDESMAQVDLGLGDVNRQVGTSKTNLQTNTQNQIKQAGSTARNVQGQNRNVLRALGILNSSAAGQILAKPLNQFDEQRAQLGQFLVQKTTELDDFVNQKVAEASQVKNSIVGNYNDLVNKIQTDLRFNDRQRNDALQAANAALSQRMAEISQSIMNYQNQAQLQKQQFATQMAAALNYQNPQYNQQAFQALGMVNPTQTSQTAQIYQDPNKKRLGQV